ncbi:hypothetical protein [Pedobacter duraquae]|uniref:Uncharacterized protein n=1 Tax=Pedobacter duraquae TaxID=425511 RepID=A0A4R6IPM2_9SPHI|nr:hypothetical protein [Pedobacter duraquae]TDO24137.1 hypothetical protein CLV32_0424 [Pedobacter duraquae]
MKQLLFFFIPFFFVGKNSTNLVAYRKMMDAAVENSDVAERIYGEFKAFDENGQSVLVGYRGISELLMCKHVFNPVKKIAYFRRGRALLESAIKSSPGDPELIFLRYTTQVNVPSILNYSANLDNDKDLLIAYLQKGVSGNTDQDLYCRIKNYMEQSRTLTAYERSIIKNLL